MRRTGSSSGFTYLEILIAMGILVTFLAVMGGLVGVAGYLLRQSKAELQRVYTQKAVFELVAGSEAESLPSDSSPLVLDSLTISGDEWLEYGNGDDRIQWQARINVSEAEPGKTIEVEVVPVTD